MLRDNTAAELKAIVGAGRYIDTPEALLAYSYDAFVQEAMPEAVILPETTAEWRPS
ncbi:hypothetical protein [Desulfosarcina cetonica]|uniref:hypothetical protein n=1 Tax=Desulfosarcina cetonica TaxID=90730 RepID=UPI0012EDBEA5|nr:hypothetical protein [Desulfosarcina cetonica]